MAKQVARPVARQRHRISGIRHVPAAYGMVLYSKTMPSAEMSDIFNNLTPLEDYSFGRADVSGDRIEAADPQVWSVKTISAPHPYHSALQEIHLMRLELGATLEAARALKEELTERLVKVSEDSGQEIHIRDLSPEEAKKEILELFDTGHVFYYSDIAEKLGLDLKLVVDVCAELRAEGKIAIDEASESR